MPIFTKFINYCPVISIVTIVLISTTACSPPHGFVDRKNIKEIDYISDTYGTNDAKTLESLTCVDGLRAAKKQAREWNNDAQLIGVASAKARPGKLETHKTVWNQLVWLYLFKDTDGNSWLAVSVGRRNGQIEIIGVGCHSEPAGLKNWHSIGATWHQAQIEGPEMELEAFHVEERNLFVWTFPVTLAVRKPGDWGGEIQTVDAVSGERIVDKNMLRQIAEQRWSRISVDRPSQKRMMPEGHNAKVIVYEAFAEGEVKTNHVFQWNSQLNSKGYEYDMYLEFIGAK